MAEVNQFPRDLDVSPRQILQPSQQSTSLGVIGRRSVPDLGTIGDNVSASVRNSGASHDLNHNYQMLQAAYYKLPQPRDSERIKNYAPVQIFLCSESMLYCSFMSIRYLRIYISKKDLFMLSIPAKSEFSYVPFKT